MLSDGTGVMSRNTSTFITPLWWERTPLRMLRSDIGRVQRAVDIAEGSVLPGGRR